MRKDARAAPARGKLRYHHGAQFSGAARHQNVGHG
jgi:hypothetical protein